MNPFSPLSCKTTYHCQIIILLELLLTMKTNQRDAVVKAQTLQISWWLPVKKLLTRFKLIKNFEFKLVTKLNYFKNLNQGVAGVV